MKKVFLGVLFTAIFTSCTSSTAFDKGKEQLENMGYTDVENTGHAWFCCGDDDDFSTGFTAKNKKGEEVKGCFCSGFGKGVTIRFQ